MILNILRSTESAIQFWEGIVGFGGDSRAGHYGSKIDDDEINGGKIDDEVGKKGQKTSKSKNLFKSKNGLSPKRY